MRAVPGMSLARMDACGPREVSQQSIVRDQHRQEISLARLGR